MYDHRYIHRIAVISAALVPLTACPAPSGDGESAEDESSDTGDEQACLFPGSALLSTTRNLTGQLIPGTQCTEGWATDAPTLEATWSSDAGLAYAAFFDLDLAVLPNGGVVVSGPGVMAGYNDAGEQQWVLDIGGDTVEATMAVAPNGDILLGTYDYDTDEIAFDRYDGDGNLVGPVAAPFISPWAYVWGIGFLGDDMLLACFDENLQGWDAPTLLRVGPDGEELLRKSNPNIGAQSFAVNAMGTVLFSGPLVAADNGAVLGTLTPSSGGIRGATAIGDDFIVTGASGDLTVGRYSPFGAERWQQAYDRAGNFDQGRAIATSADGNAIVAVGGTAPVHYTDGWWFNTQPQVVALDGDGNASWTDRIDAVGIASAVAIAPDGAVYVAGLAEQSAAGDSEAVVVWLRRYDP